MRPIIPTVGLCCVLALSSVGPAGAVTEDQFRLRNTGDLAALCAAPATDPLYTAAVNFCHGFGVGAYSILQDVQAAKPSLRLFCVPPELTRTESVASFVAWAGASAEHAALSATDGVTAFLRETYPCPKLPGPKAAGAPAQRRTP